MFGLQRLFGNVSQNATTTNFIMALATIFAIAGVPYLEIEMNRCVKGFFKNPLVRKIVLFSSIYLNTQDAYMSGFITIIYTIIVEIVLGKPLEPIETKPTH